MCLHDRLWGGSSWYVQFWQVHLYHVRPPPVRMTDTVYSLPCTVCDGTLILRTTLLAGCFLGVTSLLASASSSPPSSTA